MKKAEQDYIKQIQAALMEIPTKGQDTLVMSECLRALSTLATMPVDDAEETAPAEKEE